LIDKAAENLYNTVNEEEARKFVTEFSRNEAENMTKRWKELYHYLVVKYTDGNIKRESNGEFTRTETGMPASPIFAGYPEWWYEAIIKATGDHFKVKGSSH
jgi:hypothetical protein